MALITTAKAAEKLGISMRRVQELIKTGRLPHQRFGRTYVVDDDDLRLVEDRKPGRPPKIKAEVASKKSKKGDSNK